MLSDVDVIDPACDAGCDEVPVSVMVEARFAQDAPAFGKDARGQGFTLGIQGVCLFVRDALYGERERSLAVCILE